MSSSAETSQMALIHWCHFHLHISHKAAKSMTKLISQLCGELQPAVCLSRGCGGQPFKGDLSTPTWTAQKQATAKAAQETFGINACLNC